MKKKRKNKGIQALDTTDQKKAEEKISKSWGNERVDESNKNWNSFTKEQREEILAESRAIFSELAEHKNDDPKSEEVRNLMIRWHHFIKNFYNPSLEVLKGLGLMYVYDPDFVATFEEIDPDLPNFLEKTINNYVEELEEKWIESQYNKLSH